MSRRRLAPRLPPPQEARRALLAAVALALAGCAAPRPARVLLTLPAAAPAASNAVDSASPAAARPLLAVRRVGLPEYLSARRVRYRADAATVAEWPHTYWAERVEVAVTRELAGALRARLPGIGVCEADCGDGTPAQVLQVELARFDLLRAAQRFEALARVQIARPGEGGTPRTLELAFTLPLAADTPQAQAEAMTAVLERLAEALAPMLQGGR